MYRIILLLGLAIAVRAEPLPVRPYGTLALQTAIDETPKPYQFSYQAEAIGGVSSRQETADGAGTVVGSYSLSDEDGRSRVVDYVADAAGFRASVKTNEPGTKNESPADVATVSDATDTSITHVAPATYSHPLRYGSHVGHRYPYNYGSLGYGYAGRYGLHGHAGRYGLYGHAGRYGALGYYGSYAPGYAGHYGYGGYHPYTHGHPHGYLNRYI
ncbi:cuticle protein 18.6-like [Centruroides vittatus]|uniref:cuticle protein 18.6-like n=1 Tax=Centruroides vittatus TaxID=120091 RepID=UPI00350E96CA